jgi:hypothetical protein
MSSFPLFSNAVAGRPIVFEQKWPRRICEFSGHPQLAGVVPASRLAIRPTPETVSCGIREMDTLTGGLPRGCLTEICGTASSGRTSLLLAAMAAATQRQEACALVDVSDAFDPVSAANAGVQFERLLWVRCGHKKKKWEERDFSRAASASFKSAVLAAEDQKKNSSENCTEQALRVTDLLLQSGGFGLVIIDLGDVPVRTVRRIPLTSWFRFQRAVEPTPTVLLVISQAPCTQSCAAMVLKMKAFRKKLSAIGFQPSAKSPSHAQLFEGLCIESEVLRSRMQRKPAQSVTAFVTVAARTG